MSFTVDLSRIVARTKGKADLAVKKVALEAFRGIVMKSPVDTGRLRANWTLSIDGFSTATHEGTDKTGAGTMGKITAGLAPIKINGQSIYLTNSLPYVRRIEYEGWSKIKAPQGMVRITLQEISAKYGT